MSDASARAGGSRWLVGLSLARRGIASAGASAEVRRTYVQLVLVLVALATALDAAGIWAVVSWTRTAPDAGWWTIVAMVLLRIAGIGIVLLVAPVVAMFAINVAFPILAERVFLAGVRQISPARAEALAAAPGLPWARSLLYATLRLLAFLALSLALLVLSFVPVVGSIAGPVLQAWRSAVALAWELLDPYFDKLGLDPAAQRAVLARHQRALLGFSLPFVFVMAIPVVGALAFGLAQAAIATVVLEVVEGEPT
jgi:uncharacterized protein involved in cysteine biosynthesis